MPVPAPVSSLSSAETAQQYIEERAVHSVAHDFWSEISPEAPTSAPAHDERRIVQHEARRRSCEARVGIQTAQPPRAYLRRR